MRSLAIVVLLAALGCGDAPHVGDDAASDVPSTVAPRVISTEPAHEATDVYPAPLVNGTSLRLRLAIVFDAPMDTSHASVELGPVGEAATDVVGVFEDATHLVVEVAPPPFANTVLRDETTYRVGLAALRGADGAPLETGPASDGAAFTFTTGALDPLLNHACGHVALGPFAQVLASAEGTIASPRTDTGHVRYTLALVPREGGLYDGFTRIAPAFEGEVHLFLDAGVVVALDTFEGVPVAFDEASTPPACAGIARVVTFPITEDTPLRARFGPQASSSAAFIVELVTE